jgi:hypothetical protein
MNPGSRNTVVLGPVRICANRGIKQMGAKDFIAGQLRRPAGFFGRLIAARYMTWVKVEINQRTLEALSVQPDDRVLEVGPGPGDLMNRIVPMAPRGTSSRFFVVI